MSEQDKNNNLPNDKNDSLPNEGKGATITPDDTAQQQAAGAGTPEDTASFEKVIEQQNSTIETLLKQVNSLNDQIARYVRTTSTPANDNQENTYTPNDREYDVTIKEDYVYLKDLGGEIGKR